MQEHVFRTRYHRMLITVVLRANAIITVPRATEMAIARRENGTAAVHRAIGIVTVPRATGIIIVLMENVIIIVRRATGITIVPMEIVIVIVRRAIVITIAHMESEMETVPRVTGMETVLTEIVQLVRRETDRSVPLEIVQIVRETEVAVRRAMALAVIRSRRLRPLILD